jgi:hypothetical protein
MMLVHQRVSLAQFQNQSARRRLAATRTVALPNQSELKNTVAIFAPLSWRFASVLSQTEQTRDAPLAVLLGGERIEERGVEKLAIGLVKLL